MDPYEPDEKAKMAMSVEEPQRVEVCQVLKRPSAAYSQLTIDDQVAQQGANVLSMQQNSHRRRSVAIFRDQPEHSNTAAHNHVVALNASSGVSNALRVTTNLPSGGNTEGRAATKVAGSETPGLNSDAPSARSKTGAGLCSKSNPQLKRRVEDEVGDHGFRRQPVSRAAPLQSFAQADRHSFNGPCSRWARLARPL
jgi:hypothetical protein